MSERGNENSFISILVAEDNEVSRELMLSVMRTQGYTVHGAVDGDSAIEVIREHDVDLAFVDINMAPKGGFEFVEYLVAQAIDVPVVIVTSDDSSDILMKAGALGVSQVLQKPVEPDRLLQIVTRTLRQRGMKVEPLAVEAHETQFSHEELMGKAIALADENAKSLKGGPFGAIVANEKGKILGRGVNGISSRVDPTAHAEVMAIRQAAEKIGQADLSGCFLYVSSEPTMMGKALIISVGIETVYYGMSHDDIKDIRGKEETVRKELSCDLEGLTDYIQIERDAAIQMYEAWQSLKSGVAD